MVVTKRNVLKVIASVYDPIGFLQPMVIKLKILFQEICKIGVDWDEFIGNELSKKWYVIVEEMKIYKDIVIKRCYFDIVEINDFVERIYLHGIFGRVRSSLCRLYLFNVCYTSW